MEESHSHEESSDFDEIMKSLADHAALVDTTQFILGGRNRLMQHLNGNLLGTDRRKFNDERLAIFGLYVFGMRTSRHPESCPWYTRYMPDISSALFISMMNINYGFKFTKLYKEFDNDYLDNLSHIMTKGSMREFYRFIDSYPDENIKLHSAFTSNVHSYT